MGGGKSRALCEDAFDLALRYPGLITLVCRQRHTAIIETTKWTMLNEVIPPELLQHCQRKESGGEDFIRLPNKSTFHFIGLEDPVKWFSSNVGALVFDEAHEIAEDTVAKLITRLRQQQAPQSDRWGTGKVTIGFNPENPGHWLQRWFILGSQQTDFGFRKDELWVEGATAPIADCEFIVAKATDNKYLPPNYVEVTLGGQTELLRRRYLEGEWLFTSGKGFFDQDALTQYAGEVRKPRWTGTTAGADERIAAAFAREKKPLNRETTGKIRIEQGNGQWHVWEPPVRDRWEDSRFLPAHRYIVAVDVSSGGSTDFSGIQVLCLETFEQVAEYQAKIDPDELAVEAYRIGRIYNDALIAPEITGGWGMTILSELQRLRYPKLYTRKVKDRLTRKWTDKLGWDTNTATRMVMLDTLERVIRERDLVLPSARSVAELGSFIRPEKKKAGGEVTTGRPEAQPGTNDDLVITLAIAVTVASELPRQLRRQKQQEHRPQFAATGY